DGAHAPTVFAALLAVLDYGPASLRAEAARMIGARSSSLSDIPVDVQEALGARLFDRDDSVREATIRVIRSLTNREGTAPSSLFRGLEARLLEETDDRLLTATLDAMIATRHPLSGEVLTRVLDILGSLSTPVRRAALEFLRASGTHHAADPRLPTVIASQF